MSNLGNVYQIAYNEDIGYMADKMPVVYENKTFLLVKCHGSDYIEQIRKEKCITVNKLKENIAKGISVNYQYVYVPCGEKFDMGEIQFVSKDEYELAITYRAIGKIEKSIIGMYGTINQLESDIKHKKDTLENYKVKYEKQKADYLKTHGVPYEEKVPRWIQDIQRSLQLIEKNV